jgi:hypothetical protein
MFGSVQTVSIFLSSTHSRQTNSRESPRDINADRGVLPLGDSGKGRHFELLSSLNIVKSAINGTY